MGCPSVKPSSVRSGAILMNLHAQPSKQSFQTFVWKADTVNARAPLLMIRTETALTSHDPLILPVMQRQQTTKMELPSTLLYISAFSNSCSIVWKEKLQLSNSSGEVCTRPESVHLWSGKEHLWNEPNCVCRQIKVIDLLYFLLDVNDEVIIGKHYSNH